MVVVDASVLVRSLVRTESTAAAVDAIERNALLAPDLILTETANALWRYVQAGMMDGDMAQQLLTNAGLVIDRFVPATSLTDRALALACRNRHPVYDCIYLALAQSEQTGLITADRKLAMIARNCDVETELLA